MTLCKHYTYVFMGDGCLMEGISQEAISLAGHYRLGKLIAFLDNNSISIDGATSLAVSDDQTSASAAPHWHVQEIDGHDTDAIRDAITAARAVTDKPSMISCRPSSASASRPRPAPRRRIATPRAKTKSPAHASCSAGPRRRS